MKARYVLTPSKLPKRHNDYLFDDLTKPTHSILTLTRRSGEGVFIGEEIEIRLCRAPGSEQIRISVCAPLRILITRAEKGRPTGDNPNAGGDEQ